MFEVKSQNKFAQKQAFQWKHWSIKRLQAGEDITYLFYCIVIMYVIREVEQSHAVSASAFAKKNSCLGHVSVLLPGRPWQRFFQPIHWV